MRPVSAAWARTVNGSHKMVARATVCSTFQTGTAPTGVRIPIFDGNVDLDGTADIRATLDLSTDGALWPLRVGDELAPYGNEIYVERGIQYSDEQVEYVGLGYFRIQSPQQQDAPAGQIRVEGRDRMAGIIDARLTKPVQFTTGATLQSIFDTLVQQVYPAAVVTFDAGAGSNVLARPAIAEEDRFKFLDSIVKSIGMIWHWDHAGELAVKPAPSSTVPVVDIMAGPGGALISAGRKLTRDRVYNIVVAYGEATDGDLPPVRGVAVDNNPNSPTYWRGRFGPVPRFFSSSFITTVTQARSAAASILRRELGLPYNVDLTATPNPALEPYDPIRLRTRDDQAAETHVLETVRIPLQHDGAFTATTREQTVTLISGE